MRGGELRLYVLLHVRAGKPKMPDKEDRQATGLAPYSAKSN
jgi:hypothetical protein